MSLAKSTKPSEVPTIQELLTRNDLDEAEAGIVADWMSLPPDTQRIAEKVAELFTIAAGHRDSWETVSEGARRGMILSTIAILAAATRLCAGSD